MKQANQILILDNEEEKNFGVEEKRTPNDDGSVNSSIRYNTIEMNSKIIRSSFRKKNWGIWLYITGALLLFYAFLLVIMTVFVNQIVGGYESRMDTNLIGVVRLEKLDFYLRTALIETNQLYPFIVFKSAFASTVQFDSIFTSAAAKVSYLKGEIEQNLAKGLSYLKDFNDELLLSDKQANSLTIDIFVKENQSFNCSSRFRPLMAAEGSDIYCQTEIVSHPFYSYVSELFEQVRRLSGKIESSLRENSVSSRTLQEVKLELHYLNYRLFEESAKKRRSAFDRYTERAITTENADYQRIFIWYLVLIMLACGINFIFSLWAIYKTSRRMYRILGCYSFLRPVEIDLQDLALQDSIDACKQFKFHEKYMIDSFLSLNSKWRNLKSALTSGFEKVDSRMLKKTFGAKKRTTFYSVKVAIGFNIFVLILGVVICVLTMYLQSGYRNSYELMISTSENFRLISRVAENFIGAELYLGFGRIHRLEDRPLEEQVFKNSPSELAAMWTRQQDSIRRIIGEQGFEGFKELLLSDFCQFIPTDNPLSGTQLEICHKALGSIASKGFTQVLFMEQEMINSAYLSMAMKHGDFLEKTSAERLDLALFDLPELYFDKPFVELRLLHPIVLSAFMEKSSALIKEKIEIVHARLVQYLGAMKLYVMLILMACILAFSFFTIKFIITDFLYCFETFRIIFPDIILNNPYLLNSFRTYFRFSIS